MDFITEIRSAHTLSLTLGALAVLSPFRAEAFVPGSVDTPDASIGLDPSHAVLAGGGDEQVDLFNGSLNLRAIDHTIPGAWGLPIEVVRSYSSKVVDENLAPYEESWVGLGWELHFGRFRDDTISSNYKWIQLPGGGMERAYWLDSTESRYRSATAPDAFPGQDASSNELWVSGTFHFMYRSGATEYSVITPGGVVYVFDTSSGSALDGWYYCTAIYNAWGGDITISYQSGAQPGAIDEVSDADGNTVSFTVDTNGYLDTMSYNTASGGVATVEYSIGNAGGSSAYVLEDVTRATGETTAFGYDPAYDELISVLMPTGGLTTYTYESVDFLWDVSSTGAEVVYPTRVLSSKSVDSGSGSSELWTYDFPSYVYGEADQSERTTTVELPTGGVIEHTFYCYFSETIGSVQYEAARYVIGKPTATEWYDSATSTAKRRYTQTNWEDTSVGTEGNYLDLAVNVSEDPYGLSPLNARIVLPVYNASFQDPDNETTDLIFYRSFGYVSAGAYDNYGNALETTDAAHSPYYGYAVGAPWTERTERTYAWDDPADGDALAAWNLVHLPATEVYGATTVGTAIDTLWRDVAWTYETAAGYEGLVSSYDAVALPTSNNSADIYRDYVWSKDVFQGRLEVTIDHGGLREERRSWQDGALERVGFNDGGTTVWHVDRIVDASTGLVEAEANANGDTTTYTWDADGRLLTINPPLDTTTTATYQLDANPPTVTVTTGAGTTTYTYDGFGRLTQVERPNGTGATMTELTDRDALGRVERVYLPYVTSAGSYAETIYDVLDRPTSVSRYDSATATTTTTTYAYDHLEVSTTNPRGYTLTTDADGYGVVRKTNAPLGADLLGSSGFTSGSTWYRGDVNYVLSSAGSLLVTQARYQDGDGQVWRLYDNQAGTASRYYVRDAAGGLDFEYDGSGDYTVYETAYHGQLSGVYYETSSTPTGAPDVAYFYDGEAMGAVPPGWIYTNPIGNRTGLRDPAGFEQYAFDNQNRVLASRRAYAGITNGLVQHNYTWDTAGNLETTSLSWDTTREVSVDTTYGTAGRVEGIDVTVTGPTGSVTTTVLSDATYHPNGAYNTLTLGNGVSQIQEIDGLGRSKRTYLTGASVNMDRTIGYDANGNVSTITDAGGADVYTYDSIDRLTGVTYADDASTESYTWDDAGNMTARAGGYATTNFSGRTFTYNRNTAWTYDAVGNLTNDGTRTYGYDTRGRLESASVGTTIASIKYDHSGRRSVRVLTSGGSTTYEIFAYDVLGRLAARYTAASPTAALLVQEVFIYLGRQPIAIVDYQAGYPEGRVQWLHPDHSGAPRMVTGGTGITVGTQEFLPFGVVRNATGSMRQDDVGYAGREGFDVHQVADFGARSLHAPSAAFASPDRVALGMMNDPMSFNRYAYARMNPTTFVDPRGENPLLIAAAGVWAVAEFALAAYDVYDTGRTLLDPNASAGDKAMSGGLFVAGMVLPGGGYTAADDLAAAAAPVAREAADRLAAGAKGGTGARFIGEPPPSGKLVDTHSTPRGSYDQPGGGRTDILQREDHGAGLSHTHDPKVNTNPRTGQTFVNGVVQPGRPVSAEDVAAIESGFATPSAPKGR